MVKRKRPAKRKARKKPVKQAGKAFRQRAFLAAYSGTASITRAAEAVRIERSQHYEWLQDGDYSARFAQAQTRAAQALEDEAVRRAHEGIEEPLVWQGEFTYPQRQRRDEYGTPMFDTNLQPMMERDPDAKPLAMRKYSDGLLQFLLRGFAPDRYRERGSVEHTGPNGGPLEATLKVEFVRPPQS